MKKISSIKQLKLMANTIRQDVIKSLAEAKSGHSAGPLGAADIFTLLYFNILKHDPKNPMWEERDICILSHGHICPVRYAAMANAGYFPREELMTLRKMGSRLQGHPHHIDLPGLESTSGPLGQGVSIAAGIAYALKMDKKPNLVYCLTSDGEVNEGQPWEAFMFAAKYKLDNLCYILDRNFIQIDGNTEEVMPLEPLKDKCESFGLHTAVTNGHDFKKLIRAFNDFKKTKGKPTMIIANTTPGKDVSFMEGRYEWHGNPPKPDQAEQALKELLKIRQKIEAEKDEEL